MQQAQAGSLCYFLYLKIYGCLLMLFSFLWQVKTVDSPCLTAESAQRTQIFFCTKLRISQFDSLPVSSEFLRNMGLYLFS